ncbi:MAG: sulfatase [Verrucomicrobia bacterium]|nr:sulfatase [Verrucomicrobiota bacterium]
MKSTFLIALSTTLLFILGSTASVSADRPNILVILVDDLRWDEIACAGHPFVRTPGIDRIAQEGARFRNAFCTTPLCSPARANLLTGQYTHRHGIANNTNRSEQSHQLMTFPRILHENGYETGYIGKWHMGNDDTPRPGFDYWACMAGQGTSFDPILNENGRHIQSTGHTTDVLNDRAVRFVRRERKKPFCLYLSHKALHPELIQFDDGSVSDPSGSKFLPAERHKQLYANAPIPRRINVTDTPEDKPALNRKIMGLPLLSQDTGTGDETILARLRMLAAVDEGVQQLFIALEETGQLDTTVILLLSDHGYWNGEHGLSVERRLAYEEGIRIPFLARFPPVINPGILIDEFALSIDLAPTLLDLANVETKHTMDGRSLAGLLKGMVMDDWRSSFLIEYQTDNVHPRLLNMGYKALRTTRYKFIQYNELEGMDELYDLKSDPYEMQNCINDPNLQTRLRQLKDELALLSGDKS